jgi:hypothetical protein
MNPTLGERVFALFGAEAPIRRLEAASSIPGSSGPMHASVAEIYLRFSRDEMRDRDLLCMIAMLGEGNGDVRELHSLYTLSSESLRSHAKAIGTGVVINVIPVGSVSDRVTQIGVLLCAQRGARATGKVVEDIQSLTAAARYARSGEGARALLAGAVDRFELLAQAPDVLTILAGVHRLDANAGAHYALLGAGRTHGSPEDPTGRDDMIYWVEGGHLWAGLSRRAASPWRGSEFLLLSIAPARAGADPNRIDRLRRQHTLLQGGAALYESKAAPETYQLKVERLRLANRLASVYGQRGAHRLPVKDPISLLVAPDLESVVHLRGEISPAFASNLTIMRDALKYELGLWFPDLRVSTAADYPAGKYAFSIDEIELVSGTLETDRLLCTATVDQLRALNIKADEAINPANGNNCAWARMDQEQALKAAGYIVWPPGGYLVLHLSSVLRKNAAAFVGIDTAAGLIRQIGRYDDIRAAPGGLPRFTDILRGMLEDEVPIHEMRAICNRYLEVTDLPTYEILEEIRALPVIHGEFRWNKDAAPIYRLGKRFLELIERGAVRRGEATVLAIEPEPTQEALTVVRNEVAKLPPTARNPVIFCEDWRVRPFVRKLVELEFPHLRVVSRRDSTGVDARPVIATIELED